MKTIKMFAEMILCGGILIFSVNALAPGAADQFIAHTVRKGETISLICIDYYGYFKPEHCTIILSDNPLIKDANMIFPGQKLRLRNPDYKPEKTEPADPVIEKKILATQGVVTYVEGDVFITPKSDNQKRKLASNTIVYPGDRLQTLKKGRVEIIINRETVVRMQENTHLTVEDFRDNQNNTGKTHVGFSLGTVWTKMKKFKDKVSRFELELPTAIAGVHGTVYEASVGKDTSAEVKVFDGEVAVSGASKPGKGAEATGAAEEVRGPDEVAGPDEVSLEQWVQIVREMQKIRIDKKGRPQAVEAFKKDRNDSWERWNEERDQRISEIFEEKE
jgi:Uncharacterized protein conserved in bacteria